MAGGCGAGPRSPENRGNFRPGAACRESPRSPFRPDRARTGPGDVAPVAGRAGFPSPDRDRNHRRNRRADRGILEIAPERLFARPPSMSARLPSRLWRRGKPYHGEDGMSVQDSIEIRIGAQGDDQLRPHRRELRRFEPPPGTGQQSTGVDDNGADTGLKQQSARARDDARQAAHRIGGSDESQPSQRARPIRMGEGDGRGWSDRLLADIGIDQDHGLFDPNGFAEKSAAEAAFSGVWRPQHDNPLNAPGENVLNGFGPVRRNIRRRGFGHGGVITDDWGRRSAMPPSCGGRSNG
jgi:hypothetical protein